MSSYNCTQSLNHQHSMYTRRQPRAHADADVASVSLVEDVRDNVPVHQEKVRDIEETLMINVLSSEGAGALTTYCERFDYKVMEAKKTREKLKSGLFR